MKLALLLSLILFAPASAQESDAPKALASGGSLRSDQAAFDVEHVTLEITVDPATKTIEGTMSMNARCLYQTDQIALDLDYPLEVRSVSIRGEAVKIRREAGRILIPCDPPLVAGGDFGVVVDYGGTPREAVRAPWDGGFTWAETDDGQPWFTTTCQGEGADLWWPCKDHPSDKPNSFDLFVRVPEGLIVASNGVLLGTESANGWTRFHWHVVNPISNYNIALNVGPFELVEETFQSVAGERFPVQFYCLQKSVKQARALMPEIIDHLNFFERFFGPYPFRNEKYGVVETPHLGMEHQTIIAYGYKFQRDRNFDYDWLHHHELSHEWWGNLITCRDWKDMWIHEGFGTYAQALYVETKHGREGYLKQIREHMRTAQNETPLAPRKATNSKDIYFGASGKSSNDIYYKGSGVIHALRWVVGDDVLFQSLKTFCYPTPERLTKTDGSQVRFVDTNDYIGLTEQLSGSSLDWFFDVYLRTARLPQLEIKLGAERLELRWETETPFPMPVPVMVDGELVRVECPKGRGSLRFARGAQVEVDPDTLLFRARK